MSGFTLLLLWPVLDVRQQLTLMIREDDRRGPLYSACPPLSSYEEVPSE